MQHVNRRLDTKKENTDNEDISDQLSNILEGNPFGGFTVKCSDRSDGFLDQVLNFVDKGGNSRGGSVRLVHAG